MSNTDSGNGTALENTRAAWDTAYIDDLPDSSFLYVEPGGQKDSDGKTVPRSNRHFPVRDAQGNVDADHVRNALARIPDSNVPAEAKAHATAEAQRLLAEADGKTASSGSMASGRDETPPRDSLVRTSLPFEILRSADNGMPILHGRGAVYSEWTEINSRVEGHFMERFSPGAFTKTIADQGSRIRCLFNHGQDPSIGMKPLGPITDLSERNDGVHYEVKLLDTPYNRDLVPGLKEGLYGSSFRFGIVRKDDIQARRSTSGLLERTISEATMRELGPTPFPAYGSTSAGIRSLTDEFVLGRFPAEQLADAAAKHEQADRDLIGEMTYLANKFSESHDTDSDAVRDLMVALATLSGTDHAPSEDAAPVGTSARSAAKPTNAPLWGAKEEPSWRL